MGETINLDQHPNFKPVSDNIEAVAKEPRKLKFMEGSIVVSTLGALTAFGSGLATVGEILGASTVSILVGGYYWRHRKNNQLPPPELVSEESVVLASVRGINLTRAKARTFSNTPVNEAPYPYLYLVKNIDDQPIETKGIV